MNFPLIIFFLTFLINISHQNNSVNRNNRNQPQTPSIKNINRQSNLIQNPTNRIKQNIPKYICSIQDNGNDICSCVIIDPTTVITAAHCVNDKDPTYYKVVTGSNNNKTYEILSSTTEHFEFHLPYYDDIIKLTLKQPIQMGDDAEQIQIPSQDECTAFPFGKYASIWGSTDKNSPSILNEIKVKILTGNDTGCRNYHESKKIIQTMFCAGWDDGRIDPCKAEAGSPLVFDNKLYGIASWGKGCKRPTQGGVYANYCKFAYNYRDYDEESYQSHLNDYDIFSD